MCETVEAAIGLADLRTETPAHEVLKFFVGPQTEHFFAATHSILQLEVLIDEAEEGIELVGLTPGENVHKLVSYMVRDSTREARLTCRCGSHRTATISRVPRQGEGFVRW